MEQLNKTYPRTGTYCPNRVKIMLWQFFWAYIPLYTVLMFHSSFYTLYVPTTYSLRACQFLGAIMTCAELKYSFQDLSLTVGEGGSGESENGKGPAFDRNLWNLWEDGMKNGLFRYILGRNSLPCKVLPGRFNYVAQLNTERAEKRRKPQEIQSPNQPFNPDHFNFNQVRKEEELIRVRPEWMLSSAGEGDENLLLINVSPLEYCHVLLTPFRNRNRPQRITREGLRMGLELVLLSNSSDLRVGFNSLCGFASVNHEHWHAYYLSHRLYVESSPLKSAIDGRSSTCLQLEDQDFPPGFCFVLDQARTEDEMERFLEAVMTLVAHLQDSDTAHNVYITRGSTSNKVGHFDSGRVFVWARTSSFGAKVCEAFNPALCELAGHLPIKNEEAYNSLTEQFILSELHGICDEPFKRVKEWVSSNFPA